MHLIYVLGNKSHRQTDTSEYRLQDVVSCSYSRSLVKVPSIGTTRLPAVAPDGLGGGRV